MWDFSFATCLKVLVRTWPFLLLRALVFGGFAALFVLMVASGGVIGHEIGPKFVDLSPLQTAIFGAFGGVVLGGAMIRILREYTLYLVKAGHIAVMGDMLAGGPVPKGLEQISSGARTVRENFWETSTLFVFDQMIKAVLKTIEDFIKKVGMFIPFLAPLFALAQTVIVIAITYVDEMILAHIMRMRPANPWKAGADALVIYAQNAKAMLRNAFWLACFLIAIDIALFAAIFLLAPVPELALMGEDAAIAARIIAGVVGLVLFALIIGEPLAVCAMLQAYNAVADGQTPDPDMERKLADKSADFRELRNGGPGGAPGALFQPAE